MVRLCHPFFVLLLLLQFPVKANMLQDRWLSKAYQETSRLRLKNSYLLLRNYKGDNAHLKELITNYNEYLDIILNERQNLHKAAIVHSTERIKHIEKLDIPEKEKLFVMAELSFHEAVLNLYFSKNLEAFLKLKKAYRLSRKCYNLYPSYLPNYKTYGIIELMIGSLTDEVQNMLKAAGLKGDFKLGNQLLEKLSKSNNLFAYEAGMVKYITESFVMGKKVRSGIDLELKRDPDNLTTYAVGMLISFKNNNTERVIRLLKTKPSGPNYVSSTFFQFLDAETKMLKGNYGAAALKFSSFIFRHEGKNLLKTSYLRLAQCHWLLDNKTKAKEFLSKVRLYGHQVLDSDKYSEEFAKKGHLPRKDILKARLMTDGGYFRSVIKLLSEIDQGELNNSDLTEYYYRFGRVYQKTETIDSAKKYYQLTITTQKASNDYFAPHAALQLGYIYRSQGSKDAAKLYFKRALSYHSSFFYKRSIHHKARVAIQHL